MTVAGVKALMYGKSDRFAISAARAVLPELGGPKNTNSITRTTINKLESSDEVDQITL